MDNNQPRKRPRRTYDVSAEQIIRVWQSSRSLSEAALRLGMPKLIAAARAAFYRKSGLALKYMTRHDRRRLDIETLNHLIEELDRHHEADKGPSSDNLESPTE
jgi:hypothetical protein